MNSDNRILVTGCRPIDDLLGGGIEGGVVTQVYGEAGSGKTNLCIQTAVECVRSGMQAADKAYSDLLKHLETLDPDAGKAYLTDYAGSLGIRCENLFSGSDDSGHSVSSVPDSSVSGSSVPDSSVSGSSVRDSSVSGSSVQASSVSGSSVPDSSVSGSSVQDSSVSDQDPAGLPGIRRSFSPAEEAVLSAVRRKLRADLVRKVVYIDTEGLSAARFRQIAGDDAREIAGQIVIFEPMDLDEQYTAIREIENIAHLNIGLVIIDSATSFYRYELDDDVSGMQSRRELTNQIGFLHGLSRKYGFAALITNQVFSEIGAGTGDALRNMTGSNIRAIGGRALEHISKTILFLEKAGTGERKATIVKHRSKPEGDYCRFRITEHGLE